MERLSHRCSVLGVMSAKNAAVNILILTTFISFLFYKRASKEPVSFDTRGPSAKIIIGIGVSHQRFPDDFSGNFCHHRRDVV